MSIFKKFFGSSDDISDENPEREIPQNQPLIDTSVEELFTLEFKKNGGKFIYCENSNEVKSFFEDILEENDWYESEAICSESKLFHFLSDNNINFTEPKNPRFLFSCCENLIADEGSILLCSNQIKQHKPQELPFNIIVFATTSQIVQTRDDGMSQMRKRYINGYPSNITAMKYFEKAKEEDFLHYGSVAKNVYLLLLEDL